MRHRKDGSRFFIQMHLPKPCAIDATGAHSKRGDPAFKADRGWLGTKEPRERCGTNG